MVGVLSFRPRGQSNRVPWEPYFRQIEGNLRRGNATEHTHRPALKSLLEALERNVVATNEPKRVACGAPDFVVTDSSVAAPLTIGYVEAKDVGVSLEKEEESEQPRRYRSRLHNLVLGLHGNTRKREVAPDGSKGDNVFDIQQSVAVCLMVKLPPREPERT